MQGMWLLIFNFWHKKKKKIRGYKTIHTFTKRIEDKANDTDNKNNNKSNNNNTGINNDNHNHNNDNNSNNDNKTKSK